MALVTREHHIRQAVMLCLANHYPFRTTFPACFANLGSFGRRRDTLEVAQGFSLGFTVDGLDEVSLTGHTSVTHKTLGRHGPIDFLTLAIPGMSVARMLAHRDAPCAQLALIMIHDLVVNPRPRLARLVIGPHKSAPQARLAQMNIEDTSLVRRELCVCVFSLKEEHTLKLDTADVG